MSFPLTRTKSASLAALCLRLGAFLRSYGLCLLALCALGLTSCSGDKEKALDELKKLGINPTPEKFIDQVSIANTNTVRLFIRAGFSANLAVAGTTPLRTATEEREPELIPLLVRLGAEIDRPASDGFSSLQWCARNNRTNCIPALIKSGANAHLAASDGLDPLSAAISTGSDLALEALLKAGVEPTRSSDKALPPVILATALGKTNALHLLARSHADLNATDSFSRTAVNVAIWSNRFDSLKTLAALGADLSSRDTNNWCSLRLAMELNRNDAWNLLLSRKAGLETTDKDGRSPLHAAVLAGLTNRVNDLLAHSASAIAQDRKGTPLLFDAYRTGRLDLTCRLLDAGAPLDLTAPDGCTLLLLATQEGNLPFINELLKRGADLKKTAFIDHAERSALDLAICSGSSNLFQTLFKATLKAGPTNSAVLWNQALLTAVRLGKRDPSVRLLDVGAQIPLSDAKLHAELLQLRATGTNEVAALLLEAGNSTAVDKSGRPLLFEAILSRDMTLLRVLLRLGASPNIALKTPGGDAFGQLVQNPDVSWYLRHELNLTPLMVACAINDAEMVKLLRQYKADRGARTKPHGIYPINFAAEQANIEAMQAVLDVSPNSDAAQMHIRISLANQTALVYKGSEVVRSTRVSTGRSGFSTPAGRYIVTDKYPVWTSTIYKVKMPHFMRLNCSSIGLHAGVVPNYPASHGCIRLPSEMAELLYSIVKEGTLVEISPN